MATGGMSHSTRPATIICVTSLASGPTLHRSSIAPSVNISPEHRTSGAIESTSPTVSSSPPASAAAIAVVCAYAALIGVAPAQRPSARPAPKPPATKPAARTAIRTEPRVPFAPGERLSYDISWASSLTAGTAVMSVQDKKASYGSIAYYIVAHGQPTPALPNLSRLSSHA